MGGLRLLCHSSEGRGDVLQPYNMHVFDFCVCPADCPVQNRLPWASEHRRWSSGAAAAEAVTQVQLDLESIKGDGGFRL